MQVQAGDIRLFVEIVGTKLHAAGQQIAERPTIVFLHGGPAWDHRTLLPDFAALSDCAQLVFYDHRGLGRSDASTAERWTLRQWAADLKRLIETLGLGKPIIFGQSFGGIVAQQFAVDYVGAYSGLVLSATAARFDMAAVVEIFRSLGGDSLADLARAFFTAADPVLRDAFLREGMPHYTRTRTAIGAASPFKSDVLDHFFSERGEAHSFDFRGRLSAVEVPTLVIGGDADPVMPPASLAEMADSFRPGLATLRIFEQCGHGPARDRPDEAIPLLRQFIESRGAAANIL
jgi:pimeloyl-ACP methyl ester carboxylesterase